MRLADLPLAVKLLKEDFESHRAPVMELIAAQTADPFRILVGAILSARTKDACTAGACERLFSRAKTKCELASLTESEIAELIFPVGFFRTKAKMLHRLPAALDAKFGGAVPDAVEELCQLPGVGRKSANLVVALGFRKDAICVDIHVHRISNRFGLISTSTPYESEMALRKILPRKYWQDWNSFLVAFGQTRCAPRNPLCEGCPLAGLCDFGAMMLKRR